jgi:hypothetical protein
MELKRLEHQEMGCCQKSARKKLFPRHHSEECVVPKGHQTQAVSGTEVRHVPSWVKEKSLDTDTNTVVIDMKNENTNTGMEGSSTLERPLQVKKIKLIRTSSNLILPTSGKKLMTLVKVHSLPSKKENHITPTRETNCSFIDGNGKASNTVPQIHSPSITSQIDFTNLNDATTQKLPHLRPSAQPAPTSHVKETNGLTDVGSSVPKVLCMRKGVTVIDMRSPALTQCRTVPSNGSGNLMAGGAGNKLFVPARPVVPKQVCSPSGYVYKIGKGGGTAGLASGGKIYQAVQVGTVIQLVPLCNNSLSLPK